MRVWEDVNKTTQNSNQNGEAQSLSVLNRQVRFESHKKREALSLSLKNNGWGSIGFRRVGFESHKKREALSLSLKNNGWGGRIRTHECRDQNPVPYRLATPQSLISSLKRSFLEPTFTKNTTKIPTWAMLLIIFLFFSSINPAQSVMTQSVNTYKSKKIIKQNLGQKIELARYYRNGVLYTSQGQLYFNLDPINLINSNNDDFGLKVNNIIVDGEDFYLATDVGIFQNYRRIYGGEKCYHLKKSSKKIFISCQSGIYESQLQKKTFNNFEFSLITGSPREVKFFGLNRSKTKPLYAVADNGFYFFDRKSRWKERNSRLSRNFMGEFAFGRFCLVQEKKEKDLIVLATASGVYLSNDEGQNWSKLNQGLEANFDGFFDIYEIKQIQEALFLASSTGLYKLEMNDDLKNSFLGSWQKIPLKQIRSGVNNNLEIYSLDQNGSKILISTGQGEILELSEKQALKLTVETKTELDSSEKKNKLLVKELISCEPKIQDLHKKALEFAGIPTGNEFKSYRRKARLRNFMPEMQAFVERDQQDYLSIETQGEDNFNSSTSALTTSFDEVNINRDDNAINSGLRLSWQLGNLFYDPEINDINTSARLTANIRENLLTEITQIYYQRKELLYKYLQKEFLGKEELNYQESLQLEEYSAELDARTGAWFGEKLASNLSKQLDNIHDLGIKERVKELYAEIRIN